MVQDVLQPHTALSAGVWLGCSQQGAATKQGCVQASATCHHMLLQRLLLWGCLTASGTLRYV